MTLRLDPATVSALKYEATRLRQLTGQRVTFRTTGRRLLQSWARDNPAPTTEPPRIE